MYYEVVIVGAGLSGIRSALAAYELGLERVLIIDYEKNPGGFSSSIFRQKGLEKERELLQQFESLPYDFWSKSTIVGFFEGEHDENHELSIQTPSGTKEVETKIVIFCTGALEKPRESNRIAGTRPSGIMTPNMALSLSERNLILGQEVVFFVDEKNSIIADVIENAGIKVQKLSKEDNVILNIQGNSRLSSITVLDKKNGEESVINCDTLVYSNGFVPSTFYLKGTGVNRDENNFIVVDKYGRTNVKRVFSYGSCTTRKFDYLSENSTSVILDALKMEGLA